MAEQVRGQLRIYLGAAAGAGKTFDMLSEGHRRAERGADVVVAFVETHGRPHTAALLDGLEIIPRTRISYRGTTFEEMDLDAVLARRPGIALVDEFAHTNVPGSRHAKRWEDVEELLAAGIEVISNVNIQHLESLNDVVQKITGVPQRETVPDAMVRAADQVELVDMTPEALRRRMAHGNIYPPEKIDAALTNYFRTGNLTALRELALLWLADKVDEGLQRYRAQHGISGRQVAGYALAAILAPLLTITLAALRGQLNLTSDVLTFLTAVIIVALVGGFVPAVLVAIAGFLLLNYYFTPPLHKWTIAEANNWLALGVFVAVALIVSSVVDTAARRTRQAARASAESELLVTTAGSVLRGQRAVEAVLDRVREAFGMESVTLLECQAGQGTGGEGGRAEGVFPPGPRSRGPRGPGVVPRVSGAGGRPPGRALRGPTAGWQAVAHSGEPPVARPEDADVEVPVAEALSLALRGRALPASDRRVLGAFAAYAAVALEQQRLAAEAKAARPIAEADRMRTALLAAVSHDLRTPLASAKAAVTSLRSDEVQWGDEDRDELLATADESLDRLAHLVDNLLDMSRLQAGALSVFPRPAGLDEIVARALDDIGAPAAKVTVDIPDSLPEVRVDPAILERVVVNLTENALRYSPAGTPPLLAASALGDRVELRVVDRGPGIPRSHRDRMFVPFQRLGDTDNTTGVGLGLALSRGLTEAMGGTLDPEETPGGGLTMTLSLPAVPVSALPHPGAPGRLVE